VLTQTDLLAALYHRQAAAAAEIDVNTTEIFLIAMTIIFPALAHLASGQDRLLRAAGRRPDHHRHPARAGHPGQGFPDYYQFVFNPAVVQSLNGIAWWAVMLFVMIAGIELDLRKAWAHRRESGITAGLALGTPLLFGCGAAALMLGFDGWMGQQAQTWQFVVGVGMACAVTALPILILLMEKLDILRQPIGQRILRYASLDDIAIWGVLALILMDWERIGRQGAFLLAFAVAAWLFHKLMARLGERDRWYVALIWLAAFPSAPTGPGCISWSAPSWPGPAWRPSGSIRRRWICCATTCCWSSCRSSSCPPGCAPTGMSAVPPCSSPPPCCWSCRSAASCSACTWPAAS
jgi:hypothetical protein